MNTDRLKEVLATASAEIGKVIIGQKQVIEMSLITIFTGSHALIEGVPGVAKTLLVRTLAKVLGCDFQRIQFTPDMMPADIIGTNVFDMKQNTFTLIRGPVFTTFLLADEINRAPAKTQSALLQAMQERQVTIDRATHQLSPNFTVFATQNPIEYEGTYPLPEAQKDRFMFKIQMECPNRDEELELAARMLGADSPEATLNRGDVKGVMNINEMPALKTSLQEVTVNKETTTYIVDIIRETRKHSGIMVGAGPRATQALIASSRTYAALRGRDFVTPDDIRDVVHSILSHRIILKPEFEIEGLNVSEVITQILQKVAVPR